MNFPTRGNGPHRLLYIFRRHQHIISGVASMRFMLVRPGLYVIVTGNNPGVLPKIKTVLPLMRFRQQLVLYFNTYL
jgi:hypothetical protein